MYLALLLPEDNVVFTRQISVYKPVANPCLSIARLMTEFKLNILSTAREILSGSTNCVSLAGRLSCGLQATWTLALDSVGLKGNDDDAIGNDTFEGMLKAER